MGDRGTFKSGDSMSSHSKDSMAIINNIVVKSKALWVGINTDSSTKMLIDMPFKDFMYAIEHIRETIEEWETLCDELDDNISELRKTLETLAGNCPYRDKYCDLTDCAKCDHARINVLTRQQNELEVQRDIIKDRESIIESLRTQQAAQRDTIHDRDEIIQNLRNELKILKEDALHWHELALARTKEIDDMTDQIADLTEERDYYQDCLHKLANRASNFCGNCKHYAQMHKDNDTYEGICVQHYIKRVDPDDASCEHFKSNQVDKPDQPCCKACDHDDCDNCTLCPF